MVKILVVQGSPNPRSATAAMLRNLSGKMEGFGGDVDFLDMRETPLPLYIPGKKEGVENLEMICERVNQADAFVLGTPDYHGGPSGTMRNFLDYFWREFSGKLFGYVCASHEKGLTTMDMVRVAVRQCYGWSLPYGVAGMSPIEVEPEGKVVSEKLDARLTMMARDMVTYGEVLKNARETDLAGDHPCFMAIHRPPE